MASSTPIKWSSSEVRKGFIDFFVSKNHLFVPSSPVLPHEDPTLLFTNAGMNQFKPLFLGQVDPKSPQASWKRVANTQKCIRAGGKHNDLDDVGKDVYHHTFFEMLGNWSFGDYFKKEAIDWAWELLTEVYKLDKNRIYVTFFGGNEAEGIPRDDEARSLWLEKLPAERVLPFGMKENFWEMGETGPCGPCSEIHYDKIGNRDATSLVNADDPTVIEIWNNVFMQFNRGSDGKLVSLPAKSVDTGMGLERLTAILQDVPSNYDIDLFSSLFQEIRKVTDPNGPAYSGKVGKDDIGKIDMAYRVVADHIRTLTFAINDGVIPSNTGRGYVLRRILRRAIRYGRRNLNAKGLFFYHLVDKVVELMSSAFPELSRNPEFIKSVIKEEEESFAKTLDRGEKKFLKETSNLKPGDVVSGRVAFKLYSTYGFPLDLTQIMAEEKGLTVDLKAFNDELKRHSIQTEEKEVKIKFVLDVHAVAELRNRFQATDDSFKYKQSSIDSTLKAIVQRVGDTDKTTFVDSITLANNNNGEIPIGFVFDQTNFYAESGGQIYDVGIIEKENVTFNVLEVQVFGGYVLHIGTLKGNGNVSVGEKFKLSVNYDRRKLIVSNHTSTHLINFALRKSLGDGIDQKGSLVVPDKLRFDFSHPKPVSSKELVEIDQTVNDLIKQQLEVFAKEISLEQATKINGVRAVFGDTYPDPVRVISIGKSIDDLLNDPSNNEWKNFSIEFCGGTHLSNTRDAKVFTVIHEEALAKGVRRIIAFSGQAAQDAIHNANLMELEIESIQKASKEDKITTEELALKITDLLHKLGASENPMPASRKTSFREQISSLQNKLRDQAKQTKHEQQNIATSFTEDVIKKLTENASSSFFVGTVNVGDHSVILTDIIKQIHSKFPDTAVLLLSPDTQKKKVCIVANVPKSLVTKGFKANEWASETAKSCGGKGGGKPETAQGAGNDPSLISNAETVANNFAKSKTS